MKRHFHVAVIGSGFGGTLTAMISHRLGFPTLLIERGRHPRFAIGESSTPLANLLLEELAEEYGLEFVRPLCKWGAWQKQLPQVACGIKRGFTFYRHDPGQPFAPDPERERQLLVGASPCEEIADTHWYRPDFDHYLVQQAKAIGVEFWEEANIEGAVSEADGMRISGTRGGRHFEVMADFTVDASGPRGFLFQSLGLEESAFDSMPATQALFSHFRDVGPLPEGFVNKRERPPYPPEQAAVHHVFPGGWVWVLKFNNGITSAGVAATDAVANELDFKRGEGAWRELLERFPSLREIFGPARAVTPFFHSPRPAFRAKTICGPHWALLPSAAGFVDPLLSTGFPLTLLGISRVANLLKSYWQKAVLREQLDEYSRITLLELDAAARLAGALYATMDRFEVFRELSLLYFAPASFSETARRLGKGHLADSFLLCRDPVFARRMREICDLAVRARSQEERNELGRAVAEAIEPIDVAGLSDKGRRSWYPALASDLLRSAWKLGASEVEVLEMLKKCGMAVE
jgi:FADH2 O2-dependent halogenase